MKRHENETIEKCISKVTDTEKLLEPVCCEKQQRKVPDQLLVCGTSEDYKWYKIDLGL